MSFVSSVSQTLMDKCEAEGIPISLAAVKAQGEASLKYVLLASFDCEWKCANPFPLCWRNPMEQRHIALYAALPRQIHRTAKECALMQKMMMPVKLW